MEETIKRTDDMETVLDSDLQFHRVITECTEEPLLCNIYEYRTSLTIPLRKKAARIMFDTGNREIFMSLHEEIVNMFVSNDRSKILENVKKHYIFWKDEKEKEKVLNQLKEWGVEVITSPKLAEKEAYEQKLAEKINLREQRQKLYKKRNK